MSFACLNCRNIFNLNISPFFSKIWCGRRGVNSIDLLKHVHCTAIVSILIFSVCGTNMISTSRYSLLLLFFFGTAWCFEFNASADTNDHEQIFIYIHMNIIKAIRHTHIQYKPIIFTWYWLKKEKHLITFEWMKRLTTHSIILDTLHTIQTYFTLCYHIYSLH